MDIRDIARDYISRGWAVVPVSSGLKSTHSRWRTKVYTPDDFKATDGIALKCGEPSGWLVDVDLDCPEAVIAAKVLLPTTGLIHGRPGKPDSHYWYLAKHIKTSQFTDIKGGGMLVEVRSTGGYTVVPPSGHPSGDVLAWASSAPPLSLAAEDLYAPARAVGITAVLARHWPGAGGRHAVVGHLAGFLLQAHMPSAMVLTVISTAAEIAHDPDLPDRIHFAQATCAKHAAGEVVTGGPSLADELGADVVAKIRGWLRLADVDALEEMNQKHFWVRMGKDDAIGREDSPTGPVFQKTRALYSEYANRKIQVGVDKAGQPVLKPLFQEWLESPTRRSYTEVGFWPPPLTAPDGAYNLWKGFALTPARGECDRFLEHLYEVICGGNDAHYRYLTKLCAYTVQYPGLNSEVATVLRGKPGTGKGTFVRAFQRIFGRRHFAHLDRVEDLVQFNALISGKVIVFADEAFFAGDKREQGTLRRVISEPTIRITRKGIDSVEETNCVHLFMATNDHWSAPAQTRERRYFALSVAEKHMQDHAYFSPIEQELNAGGAAAFLWEMLQVPVTADEIRAVPKTAELRRQQDLTMAAELRFWQECLMDGAFGRVAWGPVIPVNALYEIYREWAVRASNARVLDKTEFGRRIALFATREKGSKVKRSGSGTERCWVLRTLEEAREVFDREMGTSGEWPDVDVSPSNTIPF